MSDITDRLKELGYDGDYTNSNIIDWIRSKFHFNIWVEHGITKKDRTYHDVTTDYGCHRGSYNSYEDAQLAGIKIFLKG